MTPNKLHLAMIAGVAATVGLIWFAPQGDSNVSEPAKASNLEVNARGARANSPAASKSTADNLFGDLPGSALRPPLVKDTAAGLLAKSSWFVPPPPPPPAPPPPPPAPPPPPTAPPLPFTYLGKYLEGDMQLVILTQGNRVLTASPGEVLEKAYRIERIEANNVVFTYLPLGTSQTLSTGSSQ